MGALTCAKTTPSSVYTIRKSKMAARRVLESPFKTGAVLLATLTSISFVSLPVHAILGSAPAILIGLCEMVFFYLFSWLQS